MDLTISEIKKSKESLEYSDGQSKKWLQYLAAVTSTLSIFTCGMHYGWSSPSIPVLLKNDSYIPITEDEGSWIAIAPLMVEIVTFLFIPIISDKIGRKYSVLLTCPVYCLSWIVIGLARSYTVLLIARLIAGIGDNLAFMSVPIYMAEIADPEIRGALGASIPLALYLGTLVINIAAPLFTIPTMAWIAASVPVVQMLTFVWMPESPYFYLMRRNMKKARTSLQRLRRTPYVDEELVATAKAVERQEAEPGKIWDLYKVESNRKAMIITLGLKTFQLLTGETAFMFYTQYIFQQAGTGFSPYISAIIYNGLQLLFSGIASGLVDKIGRRPMLIFSCVGSIIALALETLYFYLKNSTDVDLTSLYWLPLFAMLLYVFVFSMGYSTVPYIMAGELFPTGVKTTALAMLDFYFAFLAAVVTKFFQVTDSLYGMHTPFFVFTVCTALGLIFCIRCVPETKGLELEYILLKLKGNKSENKEDNALEEL